MALAAFCGESHVPHTQEVSPGDACPKATSRRARFKCFPDVVFMDDVKAVVHPVVVDVVEVG